MKKIFVVIILFLICSFAIFNNYFWLKQDDRPHGTDAPNHLLGQLDFHYRFSDLLQMPVSVKEKVVNIISLLGQSMFSPHNVYWPNFVYLYSSFFTFIFGVSLFVTRLTMSGFFIIFIIAVYYLGKIMKDSHTGLLAAFLISMYPIIFGASRQYGLDFPLTAMTTITILFLILSNGFTNTGCSLLAGICLGFGSLIKGQIILFLFGPLVVTALCLFQKGSNLRKILNFYLFTISCILISIIWWNKGRFALMVYNLKLHISLYLKGREGSFPGETYSLAYFTWHLGEMAFSSLGIFFFGIFFLSLIHFLRSKAENKSILLLWLLVPFFLFSAAFVVKDGRFLMPVFPAVALISAYGISGINNLRLKAAVICCIVVFGLSAFFTLSYNEKFYHRLYAPESLPGLSMARIARVIMGKSGYNWFLGKNSQAALLIGEIADKASADNPALAPVYIGTIYAAPKIPYLSPLQLSYRLRLVGRHLYTIDSVENKAEFFEKAANFSYLLFIADDQKAAPRRERVFEDFSLSLQKSFSEGYHVYNTYLYKRKK